MKLKLKLKELFNSDKFIKPVIFGIKSTKLNNEEIKFFKEQNPLGFILFSRNIKNKEQVRGLVQSLKNLLGRDCLILIDQEGGRVQRLKSPIWNKYPNAKSFGDLYKKDKYKAKKLAYENYKNIAKDLVELGINVNCAPVLDLLNDKTIEAIGNRSFGDNIELISDLGNVVCDAFKSEGVFSVIKHFIGHGRAIVDSHYELPVVSTSKEELLKTDCMPFINLKDNLFGMVAHILYTDIDDEFPATLSKKVISFIRNEIGFKGLLFTDDISMKALKGDIGELSKKALDAGCDIILHCNGDMEEMEKIGDIITPTTNYFNFL
jgi:beta-N-acetylhexosaminidase